MSRFETFGAYPDRGLPNAEAALLTLWPSLNRYHDDLALIGGLAVHYLIEERAGGWPGAVTTDVDFGIALGAGGDTYGTISTDLGGFGFRPDVDQQNRLVRKVEGMNLYIDFLTEVPGMSAGTRTVDDIRASVVPGIDRALASRRVIQASGHDIYGAKKTVSVPVTDIGPLLVLKLNAFGGPNGRRHGKDAYDILLSVTASIDGPEEAVRKFQAEEHHGNPAFTAAVETLENDFRRPHKDGPVRAAEFLRGSMGGIQRFPEQGAGSLPSSSSSSSTSSFDETQLIRQDLVSVANALLGE